jgi:hypothetical protein
MSEMVWDTPEEGMSIMTGQLQIIRALAVELHKLGKLDDALLQRVESISIKKAKGTTFDESAQDDLQIRLMDFSIDAIRTAVQFLRATRDNGELAV